MAQHTDQLRRLRLRLQLPQRRRRRRRTDEEKELVGQRQQLPNHQRFLGHPLLVSWPRWVVGDHLSARSNPTSYKKSQGVCWHVERGRQSTPRSPRLARLAPPRRSLRHREIVPLNAGNVLGAEDEGPASTWLSLIRRALNAGEKADGDDSDGGRRYCLAASKQMVGIFLCVWAREGVAEHVRNVKVSCVGTGIMGYMGNKGSVSISMTIRRSTLCFVCSHLSSGEKDGDEARRNSDVMEILKRTSFSRAKEIAPAKILQHDKVIWLGDLNYRLAASGCDDATREMIEKNDWQALLERDQLRIEQGAGRILRGWEEGKISFPPTYKYLPNSDCYAFTTTKPGDKRRSPAWCDRILWRGNGMKQMSYSRDESRFSDHRPVHSLFSIEVDNYDRFQDTAAAATNNCSGNSSCSRVRAQELLVITRTQSCLSATRF